MCFFKGQVQVQISLFFSESVMHYQTLKLSSSNLCISIFSSEVSNERYFHAEPGYIVIVGEQL